MVKFLFKSKFLGFVEAPVGVLNIFLNLHNNADESVFADFEQGTRFKTGAITKQI